MPPFWGENCYKNNKSKVREKIFWMIPSLWLKIALPKREQGKRGAPPTSSSAPPTPCHHTTCLNIHTPSQKKGSNVFFSTENLKKKNLGKWKFWEIKPFVKISSHPSRALSPHTSFSSVLSKSCPIVILKSSHCPKKEWND